MKKIVYLFITLCTLAAAAQEVADFKLNVQDFRALTVVDGVPVDYIASADSAGWAVFSCPPEIASQLMFSNNAEHLTIQTSSDSGSVPGMPRVRVYSERLESASNTGDSTLRLLKTVPVANLKVQEMGNGTVEAYNIDVQKIEASVDTGCGNVVVTGKARGGKLRNVGTGTLDAFGLEMEDAKVFVFGSGPIYCDVADKMTVYGMGSGRVMVARMPAKVKQRSLGVKVELTNQPSQ